MKDRIDMPKTRLENNLIRVVESRKAQIQEALIKWGMEHYRNFPWRENRTPYSVLVSEVLLKRTTASAAKRVYEEFMSLYPNIQKLAKADCKSLEKLLLTIGYHIRRARILRIIATHVLEKYHGDLPRSKRELLEIPHIGDYTAGAILSLGYGIPSAIVDSNIERIFRRIFSKHLSKRSFRIVQTIAEMLCPEEGHQNYNYALLDFGAIVCRYGLPRCKSCPIKGLCDYYLSGNPFGE